MTSVTRHVDEQGLWAIVRTGPCPWCFVGTFPHCHQLNIDTGEETGVVELGERVAS